MGNSTSKTHESITGDENLVGVTALIENGTQSKDIGEKIAIAFILIKELQIEQKRNGLQENQLIMSKLNDDIYIFLLLLKEYVTDYESDYVALARLQSRWPEAEIEKKTEEYFLKRTDEKPNLITRIGASTQKFQKTMNKLLTVISSINPLFLMS
jgi:hypothetical protein